MPELIFEGHVYIAVSPLFKVIVPKIGRQKERRIYCLDEAELNKTLEKLKKEKVPESKIEISRFKGLGEMNEKELKETSLDPETRRLLPLSLGGISRELTTSAMNILMAAKEAESRRRWIERHGDQFEPDI